MQQYNQQIWGDSEYDFFFEWFTEPTMDQLNDLIEKIDETLAPIGVKYSTTTNSHTE